MCHIGKIMDSIIVCSSINWWNKGVKKSLNILRNAKDKYQFKSLSLIKEIKKLKHLEILAKSDGASKTSRHQKPWTIHALQSKKKKIKHITWVNKKWWMVMNTCIIKAKAKCFHSGFIHLIHFLYAGIYKIKSTHLKWSTVFRALMEGLRPKGSPLPSLCSRTAIS